jgi:Zn-dependent protease
MPKIEISEKLLLFLEFLPVFFLSLSLHEWAHAFVAYKKGDPTAKSLGRMTLNPIKHIDLVGSIAMPFISFFTGGLFIGWAKPVPVRRDNLKNPKTDDILVSIAGPISNLVMAFLFTLVIIIIMKTTGGNENIVKVLWLGVTFNVFLFLFNLLPVPPLDGSHIIYNLFPNSLYAKLLVSPMIGTLLLFVFIFSPLWKYFIIIVEYILRLFAGFIL